MDNNVIDLVGLYHSLGFYGMSSADHVEEDVFHEGIDHSLEDLSLVLF